MDLLTEIRSAITVGDVERARNLLREQVKTNPSADVYYLCSQVATNEDQRRAFLNKALEYDPYHAQTTAALQALNTPGGIPSSAIPVQPPVWSQTPPPATPPQSQGYWNQPSAVQPPPGSGYWNPQQQQTPPVQGGWQQPMQPPSTGRVQSQGFSTPPNAPPGFFSGPQNYDMQGYFPGYAPNTAQLADGGSRAVALIIDLVILFILGFIAGLIFGPMYLSGRYATYAEYVARLNSWQNVSLVLGIIINSIYYVGFMSRNGQTPGKAIMKIRVVKVNGNKLSIGDILLRQVLGYFISALVILIGFFWAFIDKDRQAWHDKLAGTIVVRDNAIWR